MIDDTSGVVIIEDCVVCGHSVCYWECDKYAYCPYCGVELKSHKICSENNGEKNEKEKR